jgi:SAM-dependent methyltransferase
MSGFSEEWNDTYSERPRLTSWPWSDLVSLVYRYCKDIDNNDKEICVFELGCGAGPNIPFFKSLNVKYFGVEGSRLIVDSLHKKFPELSKQVVVGDFTDKSIYKSFNGLDIIVDRASVTHNDVFAINKTLEYSFKALKKGGIYIGIDWFSTKHSDFSLGKEANDKYTKTDIETGNFRGVGNVHFSNEEHIRELFTSFEIISLEEKVIYNFQDFSGHQFASWNIVAIKR